MSVFLPVRPTVRVVRNPRSGLVLECPVASCLELRFTPGLVSSWRLEETPGHLVPISHGDHHFTFVVFDARAEDQPAPLRLVRFRPEYDVEVRELRVLPVGG